MVTAGTYLGSEGVDVVQQRAARLQQRPQRVGGRLVPAAARDGTEPPSDRRRERAARARVSARVRGGREARAAAGDS